MKILSPSRRRPVGRWSLSCSLLSFLGAATLAMAGCQQTGGTCLVDGRSYATGETFPSSDGCNTCTCLAGGGAACTERACVSDDLGAADLGGADLADAVMCGGATPRFPTFDRRCQVAGDCFSALHQVDCCGTQRAMGISVSERSRFEAAEKICRPMYPACGCPTRPTMADDGKSSLGGNDIKVECRAQVCTTFIP